MIVNEKNEQSDLRAEKKKLVYGDVPLLFNSDARCRRKHGSWNVSCEKKHWA